MNTTLELPDELMREVKIHAIHERKKLKDTIGGSTSAKPNCGLVRVLSAP